MESPYSIFFLMASLAGFFFRRFCCTGTFLEIAQPLFPPENDSPSHMENIYQRMTQLTKQRELVKVTL